MLRWQAFILPTNLLLHHNNLLSVSFVFLFLCKVLLWPASATTKISLAAPRHSLADPVGWEFLRGVGEISGLLPELTDYCNLSHEKKTHKRITILIYYH